MALTAIKGKLPTPPPQTVPEPDSNVVSDLRTDVDDLLAKVGRLPAVALGAWEYVDVVFGTADVDTDVAHDLDPVDPEGIRYTVVDITAAAIIYHPIAGLPWESTHIWLRASAPCTARLLLFTEPA